MISLKIDRNSMQAAIRLSTGVTPEQRKRANARSYCGVYKRRGIIQKGTCEICGSEEVEAHHEDYDKPLDVRWLCPPHHRLVSLDKITLKSRIVPQ